LAFSLQVPNLIDQGAQPERTSLSWIRTAASTSFAALFLFRYLIEKQQADLAFLLGGAALLVAPALLVVGIFRIRSSTGVWEKTSLARPTALLLVSLALSLLAAVIALAISIS
jgi:F0F1-type ATP synthase assembly protein I